MYSLLARSALSCQVVASTKPFLVITAPVVLIMLLQQNVLNDDWCGYRASMSGAASASFLATGLEASLHLGAVLLCDKHTFPCVIALVRFSFFTHSVALF